MNARALVFATLLTACGGRLQTEGATSFQSRTTIPPQGDESMATADAGSGSKSTALPPSNESTLADAGSASKSTVLPPSDESTLADAASAAAEPGAIIGAVPADVHAVAMDDLDIYLAAQSGIYRLPKSGAGGAQLLAATDLFPEGIAVDDTNVYWTDLCGAGGNCEAGSGLIYSVPKAGGTAVALASAQFRPWGIAVDDTHIYWTNQGEDLAGQPFGGGQVVSLAKGGGSPQVLVDGLQLADALVLDGDGVIFHAFDTIGRVPKAGGPVTTLDKRLNGFSTTNLVVAGGELYYGTVDSDGAIVSIATTADDTGPASTGPFGTTLVSFAQSGPNAIAISGGTLFWTASGAPGTGQIASFDLSANSQSIFAPSGTPKNGNFISLLGAGLLADAQAVYYFEYRASYDGSQQTVVRAIPR